MLHNVIWSYIIIVYQHSTDCLLMYQSSSTPPSSDFSYISPSSAWVWSSWGVPWGHTAPEKSLECASQSPLKYLDISWNSLSRLVFTMKPTLLTDSGFVQTVGCPWMPKYANPIAWILHWKRVSFVIHTSYVSGIDVSHFPVRILSGILS